MAKTPASVTSGSSRKNVAKAGETYSGKPRPRKPRGPKTPYNYFYEQERKRRAADEDANKQHDETTETPEDRRLRHAMLRKDIAAKWRLVEDQELEMYKASARQDEERYDKEMQEYRDRMTHFQRIESEAKKRFERESAITAAEAAKRAEQDAMKRRVGDQANYGASTVIGSGFRPNSIGIAPVYNNSLYGMYGESVLPHPNLTADTFPLSSSGSTSFPQPHYNVSAGSSMLPSWRNIPYATASYVPNTGRNLPDGNTRSSIIAQLYQAHQQRNLELYKLAELQRQHIMFEQLQQTLLQQQTLRGQQRLPPATKTELPASGVAHTGSEFASTHEASDSITVSAPASERELGK
mmetsp:Transcript_1664/g.3965  ORF Transcript_1664/g.3965 Transcript_1664/m.3965 type:complete len:352 (+) Transcript_1664:291-1346(+)